jgi:hypothetical protein
MLNGLMSVTGFGQTSVITAWNSSRFESFGHFFLQAQLRCELRLPDTLHLIELLDANPQIPGVLSAGRANGHVYEIGVHAVSRLPDFSTPRAISFLVHLYRRCHQWPPREST